MMLLLLLLQRLAPLPIGFAVFLVHLATIPITGTSINPARSLGTAIIFNRNIAWDDQVSYSPNSSSMNAGAAAIYYYELWITLKFN